MLLSPILIWIAFFIVLPLGYIIVLSFSTRGESGNVEYVFSLNNYINIFNPLYLKIYLASLVTAVLTTFITIIIGYPFAYFTAKLGKRRRLMVLLFMMVPFWTSSVLRTYGIMTLLRSNGVINSMLMAIGITDEPLSLLYNYGAVILGNVYMLLPFMILPLYNSIDKLDKSYIEASYDLGASKVKTFISITVPLTSPGIVAGMTLVFIPAIGLFFISDLLGGAKTMLLGNLINNQMTSARNWPFGAALSIIMIFLVLIFIMAYRKVAKKFGGVL